MRIIFSTKNNTEALLVAETDGDKTVIKALYDNKIVFGLYKIWIRGDEGKGENHPDIKPYLDKLPTLQGLAWLNVVKGFVPTKLIT